MRIINLFEAVQIALSQLNANKMRAALTMLGITIGVAAVTILISVGQGVKAFIVGQFDLYGSHMVYVDTVQRMDAPPQDIMAMPEAGDFVIDSALTQADYEILSNKTLVPDAVEITPALAVNEVMVYEGEASTSFVLGVTPDYFDIMNMSVARGRLIDETDLALSRPVVVVGDGVVEDLFDRINPIGEAVRIGDVSFRIIGVLNRLAMDFGGMASSDTILVPISTAQRKLSGARSISGDYPVTSYLIRARSEEVVDDVVQQVTDALVAAHNVEPGENPDFRVFSQSTITETLSDITNLLTVFLGAIAGVSLVVGGIGIMNIMLVTVSERTREIGLRKAVGAREGDILLQFLVEAVTLSVIGGILGTILAILFSVLVTKLVPDLDVSVKAGSILFATAVSVSVGAFFGAFPAQRAAAMNPIDALRYE